MQKNQQTLFQKLTRLFKSGPIVKRKIRGLDTTVAMPDTTKSSGMLLFQKSTTPTYSTISAGAYSLSERMMRYQDFVEMEYCLHGNTNIAVPGGYKKIRDLAEECESNPDKTFLVYAYDHNLGRIIPTLGKQARQTRIDHAYTVTFDNGQQIIGTPNHRLMKRDGTFCKIEDLKSGDAMMPFYRRDLFNGCKEEGEGYRWIYTMDRRSKMNGWVAEHRVIGEMIKGETLSENEVIHHKNFIKYDNRPENLQVMTNKAHQHLHAEILNGAKWSEQNSEWIHQFKINHSRFMIENNPAERKDITFGRILEIAERVNFNSSKICEVLDTDPNVIKRKLRKHGYQNFETFARAYNPDWHNAGWDNNGKNNPRYNKAVTFDRICSLFSKGMSKKQLVEFLNTTDTILTKRLTENGFKNYTEFSQNYENLKVVSVEYHGVIPLFDLTVDGYKNFATDTVISHNTPEIASALDIYADETAAQDEKGRVLHIHSENEKIKEILEELFYDILNVEFNLRSWTRNLVKYGDFFLYCDVSAEHGVVNVFPIPVNEITREDNYDPDDPMAIRYKWVTMGNKTLENWEVIHFRLLGNDAFIPYGSSIIEAARRIWRQLILIEDAMLVYRVVRAPERRVFYIDVANIPPENVAMYVEEQRKNLRSNQVVDRATGRVDLRYNALPVHKCTPIPLLDGTTMTIEALSKKMSLDPNWIPWVYSVQDGTKKIVPGKVAWCGKNYTATTLTKVWLDDGSYITTAPEHPFVMRDGGRKRADELICGDSLMSAYRDLNNRGYERIVEPNGERNSTHVIVARDAYKEKWESTAEHVVHHRHPENGETNKRNNSPENLEVMNFWEHRKMHAEHCELTLNRPEQLAERRIKRIAYNKTPEKRKKVSELNKLLGKAQKMGKEYNGTELHSSHNEIRKEAQNKSWAENKSQRSASMQWIIPNEVVSFTFEQIKNDPKIGREKLTDVIRNNAVIVETLKNINSANLRDISKFHVNAIVSKIHRMGCIDKPAYNTFRKFATANEVPVNHQVIKVETITNESADVYCMTVAGPNCEDDRHNFAVNGLINQQNNDDKLLKSLIFVWNSVDEDYFIPVRGGESGTKIDTLAGGQNAAAVEDVAYIQKKLFAALKIPKAYLGYDENLSSKATLAQEDIRFSRTIGVIQKTIIAELNKIAIIHLYSHGFDDEDLQNFALRLPNPSTIAQQQKLELWRSKFEIAGSAPENTMSTEFVRKQIWGLSEEECRQIDEQRLKEKLINASIESATAEEEEPAADAEEAPAEEEPADEEEGGEEAGEEEGDLFAGDDQGEDEKGSLLLNVDDPDDDEEMGIKFNLRGIDAPVKAKREIDRIRHNRARIRHAGPAKLHMPDWSSSLDAKDLAMTDPFDSKFFRSLASNPLKEMKTRVGFDVMSVLRKLASTPAFINKATRTNNLLSEELSIEIDEQDSEKDEKEIL